MLARDAAAVAYQLGAKLAVLPAIPFGNNAQQLDQVATIHLQTSTAKAILSDVAISLKKQGIERLAVLNAHGGNEFKPLIRDLMAETGTFIVQVNFFQMLPALMHKTFAEPGDHAGEMETSMLMYHCPELVQLDQATEGKSVPFDVRELSQPGVWTPRPWSRCHPDTARATQPRRRRRKGKLCRADRSGDRQAAACPGYCAASSLTCSDTVGNSLWNQKAAARGFSALAGFLHRDARE